jgi:hypothetical protein
MTISLAEQIAAMRRMSCLLEGFDCSVSLTFKKPGNDLEIFQAVLQTLREAERVQAGDKPE